MHGHSWAIQAPPAHPNFLGLSCERPWALARDTTISCKPWTLDWADFGLRFSLTGRLSVPGSIFVSLDHAQVNIAEPYRIYSNKTHDPI